MRIYIKNISLVILIIISNRCFSQVFRGKIIFEIYDNGVLDTTVANTDSYLYDHYVLEKIHKLSLVNNNYYSEGKTRISSSITKIPQYYILTDLQLKRCVEISLSDTPVIVKKYPLTEKKFGIKLFGDIVELKNEIQHFKFEKDTLIGGEKYLILKDISGFKMSEDFFVKTVKVLLSYKLRNYPIHLISESLDKKFGGNITMLTYDFKNDYRSVMITGIDPKFSNQENLYINRYIRLYEQSLK